MLFVMEMSGWCPQKVPNPVASDLLMSLSLKLNSAQAMSARLTNSVLEVRALRDPYVSCIKQGLKMNGHVRHPGHTDLSESWCDALGNLLERCPTKN